MINTKLFWNAFIPRIFPWQQTVQCSCRMTRPSSQLAIYMWRYMYIQLKKHIPKGLCIHFNVGLEMCFQSEKDDICSQTWTMSNSIPIPLKTEFYLFKFPVIWLFTVFNMFNPLWKLNMCNCEIWSRYMLKSLDQTVLWKTWPYICFISHVFANLFKLTLNSSSTVLKHYLCMISWSSICMGHDINRWDVIDEFDCWSNLLVNDVTYSVCDLAVLQNSLEDSTQLNSSEASSRNLIHDSTCEETSDGRQEKNIKIRELWYYPWIYC